MGGVDERGKVNCSQRIGVKILFTTKARACFWIQVLALVDLNYEVVSVVTFGQSGRLYSAMEESAVDAWRY